MNKIIKNYQERFIGCTDFINRLCCSLKGSLKKQHANFSSKVEPSGFGFSIFDSIEFVPSEIWNNIDSQKSIFLSTDYLKAVEKAPPKKMKFKYAILYEGNKPAVIAYFQILELDGSLHDPLIIDKEDRQMKISDKVHSKISKSISTKILICGNVLLSGEHGFAAVLEIDASKVSKGISEAIERIKRIEKMVGKVNVVLIKDFYTDKKFDHTVFDDTGYYDYFAGPNMAVPIRENWESFEDYLSDMKAKYRKRVTSTLKKGGDLTKKSLSLEEITECKEELYKLYLQVADKAKFRIFLLDPQMFQELKRFLKDQFTLDAYFVDDQMIAFTTRIFNGDVIEGYSHGLDYELNKVYDIYQNILIDDIKVGIKNKIKKINFGRTSIAMKSSLGAIPEDMDFLMRFKVKIPNQIIRRISKIFKPTEEYFRNPFE